jgi:hypothetical protein
LKKSALTTIIVFMLFSLSLVNLSLVKFANAETGGSIRFSSGVTLFSPLNMTYDSGFITLNLTFGAGMGVNCSLIYSIDGIDGGSVPLAPKNASERHILTEMVGLVELPELSDGSHSLNIYTECWIYGYFGALPLGAPFKPAYPGSSDYVASWSDTVYFTVNLPFVPPSPTLSPSPLSSPTTEPTIEPTSTPESTSTPKEQTGFLGTNLPVEYGYAIVTILVILVVAGLSLFYFKKLGK